MVLPLFDACQPALDKIFDLYNWDTVMDGQSHVIRQIVQRNCVAASTSLMVKVISKMEADGCNLNMTGVVAKGAASTSIDRPPVLACKDDNIGMVNI